MTNKLDILQSLYNATISTNPDTYGIEIEENKPIAISETDFKHEITSRNKKIEFTINANVTSDFKYKVSIYKIPYRFFWITFDKYLKYLAVVKIYKKPSGYSSNSYINHTMTFDTDVDNGRDIMSRLFDYIIDTDIKLKQKIESDKIEIYNKDLKKLISKSVTRDDALDKILDDKS